MIRNYGVQFACTATGSLKVDEGRQLHIYNIRRLHHISTGYNHIITRGEIIQRMVVIPCNNLLCNRMVRGQRREGGAGYLVSLVAADFPNIISDTHPQALDRFRSRGHSAPVIVNRSPCPVNLVGRKLLACHRLQEVIEPVKLSPETWNRVVLV